MDLPSFSSLVTKARVKKYARNFILDDEDEMFFGDAAWKRTKVRLLKNQEAYQAIDAEEYERVRMVQLQCVVFLSKRFAIIDLLPRSEPIHYIFCIGRNHPTGSLVGGIATIYTACEKRYLIVNLYVLHSRSF